MVFFGHNTSFSILNIQFSQGSEYLPIKIILNWQFLYRPRVAWGVLQTALIIFNLGSSYLPIQWPTRHWPMAHRIPPLQNWNVPKRNRMHHEHCLALQTKGRGKNLWSAAKSKGLELQSWYFDRISHFRTS